eukprot:SAG25_NODE_553_length_6984_cov_153.629339_9_plen_87_part_00
MVPRESIPLALAFFIRVKQCRYTPLCDAKSAKGLVYSRMRSGQQWARRVIVFSIFRPSEGKVRWTSPLTALNINNLAGLIQLPCVF